MHGEIIKSVNSCLFTCWLKSVMIH